MQASARLANLKWIFWNCLGVHFAGVGVGHPSIGLELIMVKEIVLKLLLGMAERRKFESPPDEESEGGGQGFKARSDPMSPDQGARGISARAGWVGNWDPTKMNSPPNFMAVSL